MRKLLALLLWMSFITEVMVKTSAGAEPTPPLELVQKVVTAAGGEAKLLKLFRMKEEYNAGAAIKSPGSKRESVVEPPKSWWIGAKERGAEPGKIAAWAWTLGVLTDPASKIESIPDVTENNQALAGLRITGSVEPPLDMYFDPTSHQLIRVDWRNDIYRFSEWKEHDGTKFPAKCVMHRRKSGEPWFFHQILELERLPELPAGLQR